MESRILKMQPQNSEQQRYQMKDEKEKELFFINIMKKINKHDQAYDNQRCLSPEAIKLKKLQEVENAVMKLSSMGHEMENQRFIAKAGLSK